MSFKKDSLVVGLSVETTHNFNRAFQSEGSPLSRRTGKVDEVVREWTEKILAKNGLKWEAKSILKSAPDVVEVGQARVVREEPKAKSRRSKAQ